MRGATFDLCPPTDRAFASPRSAGSPYCYFPFVRKLHIAHHYDRADTVGFDYRAKLAAGPAPLRCVVLALEWAYVPAVDCLLHARSMLAPLATPGTPLAHRATALTGTAAVVALLASLHAWGGPASLALYLLACMLQLHVLVRLTLVRASAPSSVAGVQLLTRAAARPQ